MPRPKKLVSILVISVPLVGFGNIEKPPLTMGDAVVSDDVAMYLQR